MNKGMNETCYGFFSALANPTRLAIVENLMDGELNVSELAAALGQEQSMISHNLKPLERCGLVSLEARGRRKFVKANLETLGALLGLVERHGERSCERYGSCPHQK
jgi:DNA-binding transcriptional ArsR family regulator